MNEYHAEHGKRRVLEIGTFLAKVACHFWGGCVGAIVEDVHSTPDAQTQWPGTRFNKTQILCVFVPGFHTRALTQVDYQLYARGLEDLDVLLL